MVKRAGTAAITRKLHDDATNRLKQTLAEAAAFKTWNPAISATAINIPHVAFADGVWHLRYGSPMGALKLLAQIWTIGPATVVWALSEQCGTKVPLTMPCTQSTLEDLVSAGFLVSGNWLREYVSSQEMVVIPRKMATARSELHVSERAGKALASCWAVVDAIVGAGGSSTLKDTSRILKLVGTAEAEVEALTSTIEDGATSVYFFACNSWVVIGSDNASFTRDQCVTATEIGNRLRWDSTGVTAEEIRIVSDKAMQHNPLAIGMEFGGCWMPVDMSVSILEDFYHTAKREDAIKSPSHRLVGTFLKAVHDGFRQGNIIKLSRTDFKRHRLLVIGFESHFQTCSTCKVHLHEAGIKFAANTVSSL